MLRTLMLRTLSRHVASLFILAAELASLGVSVPSAV